MKRNINLYKIANLYITLLLPLKKIIKGNAFCSKEAGKIFRNKRNASAQQKKWEIAEICFRCLGMLALTTTIQIKMLICSCSLIFKKNLLAFSSKKRKIPCLLWKAKDHTSEMHLVLLKKHHSNLLYLNCPLLQFRQCTTSTAQLLTVPTSQGIQSQQPFRFPYTHLQSLHLQLLWQKSTSIGTVIWQFVTEARPKALYFVKELF